ncbi:MAG TPA: glycosyltransferase family 4 protein [Gaiellaceae bacterium]|nr:glycosyltransferase family 4 protein [Gaiellaceae bacterium]
MRVLITGDTVGGVFTYVCELTRALAGRGVETTLALTGRPLSADQRRELRACGDGRVFAASFALEWMPDPWRDVDRTGEWLLRIADEVDPDLVHLNGFAHGELPWGVPALVVGHSCVLSWHEAVRRRPAGPEWDVYRARVEAGLAAADLVAAPTAAMLGELERLYGPFADSTVIPNGRSASNNLLLGRKEPFVLAAGRLWDEAKNLAALDRVAPRLDWPVLIAGDGPARAPNVRLLGRLSGDALAHRYARAAVFAGPATYEPFGLAPLEAALAGCALVLGDIPSLREVWGEAALFVDPFDDGALAAALQRVTRDDELRGRLAASAGERAARYTPGRMADGYLELYERLMVAEPLEAAR